MKTCNYHDLLEILKSNNDYCVEVTANDRYYHKISYIEYFCCVDIDQYPSLTLEKYERNDVMPSVVYSNKLKDDIIGIFPNDDLNQDVRFYNPDNDDWYFIKNVLINKDDKKLVITIASTSDIQHPMFTIIKEEK